DWAEGRSLPGPCVRLRREGGHTPPAVVPTGPAAPGRILAGRSPAQERLLCRLLRSQGLKAFAGSPKGRTIMHYDFTAIPDADVPQAVEPIFQHVLATYASETNKTVSVWRAVPDAMLDFKPHEKTNPIRTILVHQLLSERRFFAQFVGTQEPPVE